MLRYDDINFYLFSFFSVPTIGKCAQLNKNYHNLMNHSSLWHYKLQQDFNDTSRNIVNAKERYKILKFEADPLINYLIILEIVAENKQKKGVKFVSRFIARLHQSMLINVNSIHETLSELIVSQEVSTEKLNQLIKKYQSRLYFLLNEAIDPYVYELKHNNAPEFVFKELIKIINAMCRVGCELLLENIFKKQRWIICYNFPSAEQEFTFLQNAIRFARFNIVKQLINYGCGVNKTTCNYTGANEATMIASPLLTALRVTRRFSRIDANCSSSLIVKINDIIDFLLAQGADPDLICYDSLSINFTLITPKQFCERRRNYNIFACRKIFEKVISWEKKPEENSYQKKLRS